MKDVEKDGLRVDKEWMKDEIYSKGWISDELRIYEGWKMLKRMNSDELRMKDKRCLVWWIKNERQTKIWKGRILNMKKCWKGRINDRLSVSCWIDQEWYDWKCWIFQIPRKWNGRSICMYSS